MGPPRCSFIPAIAPGAITPACKKCLGGSCALLVPAERQIANPTAAAIARRSNLRGGFHLQFISTDRNLSVQSSIQEKAQGREPLGLIHSPGHFKFLLAVRSTGWSAICTWHDLVCHIPWLIKFH